jgi:hypothetical protein
MLFGSIVCLDPKAPQHGMQGLCSWAGVVCRARNAMDDRTQEQELLQDQFLYEVIGTRSMSNDAP